MLSEQEKKELLEMAGSESMREDFRVLERNRRQSAPVGMPTVLDFLTFISRLAGEPTPAVSSYPHPRMLL